MSRVKLESICKNFRGARVVDDLNLEVADGEFLVLVGPSGCGKSTTLSMIAGLEAPSAGRILIGRRDVTHVQPKARGVAMVFQNYALYPHLTVAGNLGFGLTIAKTPRSEVDSRVRTIAQTLGIVDLLERRPRELSGGQRQRVALGRAIIRDPQVFLFDEPLSNLDAQLRVQMRFELKQLQARLNSTAVYVTHDQVEAMTLGRRVVVMDKGKVQQIGTPLEVYETPRNRFVAQFMGSPGMNFIDCIPEMSGVALGVRIDHKWIPVPAGRAAAVEQSNLSRIVLGVRPEHLRVSHESGEFSLPAKIETIDALGHQSLLNLDLMGHRVVATFAAKCPFQSGDPVHVSLQPDHLSLFEPGSHGQAL